MINRIIKFINHIEDSLLVLILSTMIILAVYQIFSRNLLSEGVVWIDPLLRTLVLWVGLAGAVVATRTDKHIKIDVFLKYLPEKILPLIQRSVYLFTLLVCLLISWHATQFVMSEYEYGTIAFSGVPAWATAIIIPVSFFLIALRYGILMFSPQSQLVALKSTDAKVN